MEKLLPLLRSTGAILVRIAKASYHQYIELWETLGNTGKVVLVIILLMLCACPCSWLAVLTGTDTTPTPGATRIPIPTYTLLPTSTALPTYTPRPTFTVRPTYTVAPSATATPTELPTSTPVSTDTPRSTPTPETAQVIEVVDGDTIKIRCDGREETLRYIGIDCPESGEGEEWLAPEATQANVDLVLGKSVRLKKHIRDRDKYDRLLRYVWVGDTFVNAELVRMGLAESKAYPPDTSYQEVLDEAEEEARLAAKGLWGATPTPQQWSTVLPQTAGGSKEPSIQMCEFRPKGTPEYISICNTGDTAQDLTGWQIRSVKGNQWFSFPAGFVLGTGQKVTVYSGKDSPDNPPAELKWSDRNMWNNDGDPVELYDASRTLIHTVR